MKRILFLQDCQIFIRALPVFKITFPKSKLKEITYRNFKKFSEENFNEELRIDLGEKCVKIIYLLKTFS